MSFSLIRWASALAASAALVAPLAGQRWESQYVYDQDKSGLVFTDMAFPSAQRGVAVGYITDGKREEPVSLVTSDSGEHWLRLPLTEMPVSLFFLNENLGWMVTTKGLWRTTETGRNWVKMPKPPAEVLRVAFLDEKNGWALGARKSILETHDGAQHWKPVAGAAVPPGDPLYSAYTWIAFANPETALISGWNIPERRWGDQAPDWVDPEAALLHSDLPHLNYTLTTHDGGKTWTSRSASLFGEVERVRLLPDGRGLGLTVYSQGFHYPSGGLPHQLAHRQERQHLQDPGLCRQRHLAGSEWHGLPGRHERAGETARRDPGQSAGADQHGLRRVEGHAGGLPCRRSSRDPGGGG